MCARSFAHFEFGVKCRGKHTNTKENMTLNSRISILFNENHVEI